MQLIAKVVPIGKRLGELEVSGCNDQNRSFHSAVRLLIDCSKAKLAADRIENKSTHCETRAYGRTDSPTRSVVIRHGLSNVASRSVATARSRFMSAQRRAGPCVAGLW